MPAVRLPLASPQARAAAPLRAVRGSELGPAPHLPAARAAAGSGGGRAMTAPPGTWDAWLALGVTLLDVGLWALVIYLLAW